MTLNYTQARENMVQQQVRPWDVLDASVLDALAHLPREAFVPKTHRALAYADMELPIGHGQWMMKPVIEGRTLQALAVQPDQNVLEIGTGSGYLTACLAWLGRQVVSLEVIAELANAARARLDGMGLGDNVQIQTADALHWESSLQFDIICVGGAVDTIPPRFLQWLRPQGRLFAVRGCAPAMEAVLVRGPGGNEVQSLFETSLAYLSGAAPTPRFEF